MLAAGGAKLDELETERLEMDAVDTLAGAGDHGKKPRIDLAYLLDRMDGKDQRPLDRRDGQDRIKVVEGEELDLHLGIEGRDLAADGDTGLGELAAVIARVLRSAAVEDIEQVAAIATAQLNDGVEGPVLVDIIDHEIRRLIERMEGDQQRVAPEGGNAQQRHAGGANFQRFRPHDALETRAIGRPLDAILALIRFEAPQQPWDIALALGDQAAQEVGTRFPRLFVEIAPSGILTRHDIPRCDE